jgi:selenocysteine lyase/cysteine desulfurase
MSTGSASFDAAAVKRHFPGLADPQLHYLDRAATAQMPEAALDDLRSKRAPMRWRQNCVVAKRMMLTRTLRIGIGSMGLFRPRSPWQRAS